MAQTTNTKTMSKELKRPNRNEYFDGTNHIDTDIGIIKYSNAQDKYIDQLESKLKVVNDSLMSDEEINEIIRHYAYDAGIKLQRERTKKAIG